MGSYPGSLRSALIERQKKNDDRVSDDGESKNRGSFKKPKATADSDLSKHDRTAFLYDSDDIESRYASYEQMNSVSYKKPMATVTVDSDVRKQDQRSVIYDSDPIESQYGVNQGQTIQFVPKPPSEISPRAAEAATLQGEITGLQKQSSRDTISDDHVKRKRHRSSHKKSEKGEQPQLENKQASDSVLKPEESSIKSPSSSQIGGNENGTDLEEIAVRKDLVGNGDDKLAVGKEDNKVSGTEQVHQDRTVVSDDESKESNSDEAHEKLHYSDDEIKAMKDAIYQRSQKYIEIIGVKQTYNVPSFRNALMHMVQDYFALKPKKGYVIKAEHKIDLNRRIGNDIAAAGLVPLFCGIIKEISKTKWLDEEGNYSKKMFVVFRHCQIILFNFSDCSAEIGLEIVRTEGFLEFILEILKDSYQEHCDEATNKRLEAVLRNYMGILHNCSTNEYDECRTRLKSIHCTETLLLYLKNSQSELFRMSAISTLAEIVDEKESQLLQADLNGIKFLLARLNQALKHQQRRYLGWSAKELGRAVGRLAVNDVNKMMLVCRGALPLLVDMAKTGNEAEQIEAVHALWTLAFCKENQILMLDEPDLIDTVTSLRQSSDKHIRKDAQGTLWTLREVLRNDSRYSKLGTEICRVSDHGTSLSHVMISYQWGHQGLLIQLKEALQSRGYKVWMDVDYMEGSTLAAMAQAVEQSAAFLMSMSGKYKDSPNCRAEAEYAFQKRKRIIPLVLETGYRADGWLGIILGTKLFYDFSGKYSFQSRVDALIKELGTLGVQGQTGAMGPDESGSRQVAEKPYEQEEKSTIIYKEPAQVVSRGYDERDGYQRQSLHAPSMVSETVKSWTPEQLEAWRKRHMLNSEHLKKLTGKHLYFLRNLRNEAPEFYYHCLVKQSLVNLDLDEIMQFNEALENLELS